MNMNEPMLPLAINLDFKSGILKPCNNYICRRLSDMRGFYLDERATKEIIQQEDPVLYEVYQYDVPFENGQLLTVTSVIHPGKVGDEYYMTKGHFHEKDDTAEIYLGLQGRGYLLLETAEGQFQALAMKPGTVTYIPPYWAHRTVNVGDEDFIFFGVYPADAGHNYGAIEERGFSKLLVESDGKPTFIPNPKYGSKG
jgi:glucose-6-phosphate isomerase